ncbi:hypothetical protein [Tessaracoccus sp. OH4464_COT-324]|uniref:hypothetical protein n=1 Tax=Tessaracoccus sp. OH4464_COT-324 TaxID=2491059 RepID=UPI000F64368F|nr:hypothetical protein [Tessaracoccus sp. OH4464_COT-324]RRD46006.1 hypothetical protein EII42_09190 [Tessaracoccus sp. OH4464_COT-324]
MRNIGYKIMVACAITASLVLSTSPSKADPPPPPCVNTQGMPINRKPQFGPPGKVVRVGEPVTRVTGDYGHGVPYHGFRLRDGHEVPNGYQATYVPTKEDEGKQLIYGERVRDPRTGLIMTAYSDPVIVVGKNSAGPGQGNGSGPGGGNSGQGQQNADYVDVMVKDMELKNDAVLGDGSAGRMVGPGYVVMGNNPRGSNTPGYWKNNLVHGNYRSDKLWNAVVPWLTITPGPKNAATNTRVELSQIRMHVLTKAGKWVHVQTQSIDGAVYNHSLTGNPHIPRADIRFDGAKRVVLPPRNGLVFHGWGKEMKWNTADIEAVHVAIDARLVRNNPKGPDDRSKAQYLLQIGGDYYPEVGVRVTDELMKMKDGGSYFPGIGLSRAKTVKAEMQTFNFVTIDTAVQEPGGSISVDRLRKNPPPR